MSRSHSRRQSAAEHTHRRRTRLAVVVLAVLATFAATCPALVQAQAAPAHAHDPIAHLGPVRSTPGHLAVHGWGFDPDRPSKPLSVDITVDGRKNRSSTADVSRPDVARQYRSYKISTRHGFKVILPTRDGRHTVCITAHNLSVGRYVIPACRTATVRDSPLVGLNTLRTTPGHLSVRGWSFDPDALSTPLTVDLTVDGRKSRTLTARTSRPDVTRYYAKTYRLTNNHGFSTSIPTTDGRHTVCSTARNVSYGTNITACRSITVRDSPLVGLNTLRTTPGHLSVRGWSFDPDALSTPLTVDLTVDGRKSRTLTARTSRPDVTRYYAKTYRLTNNHGFSTSIPTTDGRHTVCSTARNVSYGTNITACRSITVRFEPTTALTSLTPTALGAAVSGWSTDPDTAAAVKVKLTVDGRQVTQITANRKGGAHSGHNFTTPLTMTSGTHRVCATGVNVGYGTKPPVAACRSISLRLDPIGHFDSVARAAGSSNLVVVGWATDPDASAPIRVSIVVDRGKATVVRASVSRADVKRAHPAYGAAHGFSVRLATNDGEHTVCITALNVSLGSNQRLGCREINAVHPKVPSAPRSVKAVTGYGSATVSWQAPTSDGGAPTSRYVITSVPGNISVSAGPSSKTVTVLGLKAKTRYTFRVAARNVVGYSPSGTSAAVTTPAGPPPQKTPAPVSTSRYIRNIHGSSATDLNKLRAEGAFDAAHNPSGHRYLVLLDIGGQDQYDGGVVLSATTRFISYPDLVKNIKSYVDGYHSRQRATAPVTVAIGTNNDMDVTAAAGRAWADKVVDPVRSYARKYRGITIAGANDIEPGFRGTYPQTRAWLGGYLASTSAAFVFNGSADGCAWTVSNRGCNNGWSMAALYHLAAGAAPTRTINLPQIYNSTMAAQWKYISLTGVGAKQPRINFGGALTEWTACDQANGCFSITGHQAWRELWAQLQSSRYLKVGSLPYSTDLRIDR